MTRNLCLVAFLMVVGASFQAHAAGAWSSTGSMVTARNGHSETLLANGKVLVTGGMSTTAYLASAELYDPAAGTWSATGSMTAALVNHCAVLLPSGMVLVAGGLLSNDQATAAAQLYNPSSGTWAPTGDMTVAREGHTAVLLNNGKVLVAGGTPRFIGPYNNSAELYDPATGTWTATGSMAGKRAWHSAVRLHDGRLLLAGGYDDYMGTTLATAELYDPGSGVWKTTASSAATGGFLTLLGGGSVLATASSGSELYDPAAGSWTSTGSIILSCGGVGTLLGNGKVLVVGGNDNSAQLYDPTTGDWSCTWSMSTSRNGYSATLLSNGKVLVAGGHVGSDRVASAELFDPTVAPPATPTISAVSPPAGPLAGGTDVTIGGDTFVAGATVTFGGTAATNVAVVDTTHITCTTPAGTGTVDVVVRNPDGYADKLTRGYVYSDVPVITSPTAASGSVGTAFSYKIEATGSPTSFGATGLPNGLSLGWMTADISGTPTAGGQYNVTLTATNSAGIGTRNLSLEITGGAGAPAITSPTSATGKVSSEFSFGLGATGSVPITFSVTALPAGLSLSGGVIQGTPTTAGQTSVTVTATNSEGTGTQTLVILIGASDGSPAILSPVTVSAEVATELSFSVPRVGDPSPSLSVAPALPAGLYLKGSRITGVPQVEGDYTGKLTATNNVGSATADLTISIAAATPGNATIKATLSDSYKEHKKSSGGGGEVDIIPASAVAVGAVVSLEGLDFNSINAATPFRIIAGQYHYDSVLGGAPESGSRGKLDLAKGSAIFSEEEDIGDNRPRIIQYGSVALKWSAKTKTLVVKAKRKKSDPKVSDNIVCGLGHNDGPVSDPATVLVEFGSVRALVGVTMVGKAGYSGGGEFALFHISAKGSGTGSK
ncbi:MAG: IPT/TIG domain-containing protein [Planctomycetota bacterium]|nr:IPT/TIG domain-containing protein [Planctomycetota bacterium]